MLDASSRAMFWKRLIHDSRILLAAEMKSVIMMISWVSFISIAKDKANIYSHKLDSNRSNVYSLYLKLFDNMIIFSNMGSSSYYIGSLDIFVSGNSGTMK